MVNYWTWTLWLLAIVASFAVLEGYALKRGQLSLSRYTWTISKAWPMMIFILGFLAGGFAVHVFWNWCPDLGQIDGVL